MMAMATMRLKLTMMDDKLSVDMPMSSSIWASAVSGTT